MLHYSAMSEWRDEQARLRDGSGLKRGVLIGAVCTCVVIGWMMFARPSEDNQSTRGFNMGAEGGFRSSARTFAARDPKTGLDMVISQIGAGPSSVLATASPAAPPTAAEAPVVPAPPVVAAPPVAADATKELASAGIPSDAKGLSRLGGEPGLLSALAVKMLDHPNVLKAIFNNKMIVDAFMSRDISKRNCESGGALKSYLSDANSGGMTKVLPVLQAAMSRPETASALVGTEMARRVLNCPSVGALANDSAAVMSIAAANPKALSLLIDPRMITSLASNPRASGLLAGVQAKLGGN